jgi:hypothetical protein
MPSSLFTHQRHEFERQFGSHFGDNFQNWFMKLARHIHSSGDVQTVRLTQGDGKLDVVVLNEQIVYQCYGPQTFKSSEATRKIGADFEGAHKFLDGRLGKWVFVHNHPTGSLDKNTLKALNNLITEIRKRGDAVEILAWGREELWDALEVGVPHHGLRELFGSPNPVHIDFACLEELLLSLERAEYPDDVAPVSQPAENKLEFNDLGASYRRQVRQGRTGLRIMDEYLASRVGTDPEFAERLAQRFRDRYRSLHSRSVLSPDEIYENLRLDAGWKASPDIKREMATRVILAYFFDTCDIFENPTKTV